MAGIKRTRGDQNGSSGPCNLFARGNCRYGRACKFSHEEASSNPRSRQKAGPTRPPDANKAKFQRWKRLLAQGSDTINPAQQAVKDLFQLGLELLDGDAGAAQNTIKSLVTDEGLGFIRAVTDRYVPLMATAAERVALWSDQLRLIFQFVTHPRVIHSAVLEQEVAALFTFILGVGGTRMVRVFDFAAAVVEDSRTVASSCSGMEAAELSLAVLSKILDCNTTSNLSDGLAPSVDRLAAFVQKGPASDSASEFARLRAAKYLDYVHRRLSVGDSIPLAAQDVVNTPLVRDGFVLRRDLPGKLSFEGPRHDNDHDDITDISIMPTMEEILSPRAEYLPTNDSTQWHKQGMRGRLDREFRLLREDTVGQLRDTIRDKLEQIRGPPSRGPHQQQQQNTLRSFTYDAPSLVEVEYDKRDGLELVVQFRQPAVLGKASKQQREDWWLHGKRLQDGALVCVLEDTGSVIYFEVSTKTLRSERDSKTASWDKREVAEAKKETPRRTLADNNVFAYVSLCLVDATDRNIGQAMRWFKNIGAPRCRYLVEFPGILLASFKYTLQALQEMHRLPDVPFSHLLAPTQPKDENNSMLAVSPRQPKEGDVDLVEAHTTLDATQSRAFVDSLSKELALIQGPPGTGKSYSGENIIKAVIDNKVAGSLGPVLCVCYTNHALDQLLEHLLDSGIKKLIRIGSRSKSDQLQNYNLRTVSREVKRTKTEGYGLYQLGTQTDAIDVKMNRILGLLSAAGSWHSIKDFLKAKHAHHHDEMFGADDDGWTRVRGKTPEANIKKWLSDKSGTDRENARSVSELLRSRLSDMTYSERRKLHRFWLQEIRDPLIKDAIKECREHKKMKEREHQIHNEVNLRCLAEADVVGVTTTGLARNLHLLRKLRCKVLVCEEAGEVLESHILTALLPSIEHAILIGDHLQLRPQIQNYELQSTNPRGKSHSLDMSLFERLVKPPHAHDISLPFSSLDTQRRMHPSIANLVRSTLYPRLVDGENVKHYPEVVGLKKRLFWLHHEEPEAAASSQDANSTSHWNAFEIEMAAALVSHLVRQGAYGPDDIAVITPYLGQLLKLRRRMESMFEVCLNDRDREDLATFESEGQKETPPAARPAGVAKTTLLKSVRVATVDNFQGEEAKVVVVSLVRSNPQNRCGFLSTPNRINVLLSRAKHGMYLLGNALTYGPVPMWSKVLAILQEQDSFGTRLELQCPRHPEAPPMMVSRPDHFVQFSPESGCQLPCDKRLVCGHRCRGRCHSDVIHAASKCIEPCPRLKRGCDHVCPRLCGDPCHEKCVTVLKDVRLTLPCGHTVASPRCWQAQDLSSIDCQILVDREVPGCEHTVRVRCGENVDNDNFACKAYCGFVRPCGHTCMKPCHSCRTRTDGHILHEDHGTCKSLCGRDFSTCRHRCQEKCHGGTPCAACKISCDVRCPHSQCSKSCSEPCSPCAEKTCGSRCEHSQCTMPCAAPCDWIPCSKRCEKVLDCGHRCPSLCGEACPASKYCQQCASGDVKNTVVDFLEMKQYHEIDLDEDPCIFPACGHFLTTASMDGQMDMGAHYNVDALGAIISIKASVQPFSMDEVKVCATCRGSLRNISRYGRIVRRAILDETTKKFIVWSNNEYASLAEQLLDEQYKLESRPHVRSRAQTRAHFTTPATSSSSKASMSRIVQLQNAANSATDHRYDALLALRQKINTYAGRVRKEEQPLQRVQQFVEHANRQKAAQRTTRPAAGFSLDESRIQTKGSLLAGLLLLKCEITVFADVLQKHKEHEMDLLSWKLNVSTHLADCQRLIGFARKTHHPRQEAEGHLCYAQLCYFAHTVSSTAQDEKDAPKSHTGPAPSGEAEGKKAWKEDGLAHVAQARALADKYPYVQALGNEIDAAEQMLEDDIFSNGVTKDEMRAVYRAMAAEFSGTGHWYFCEQGHPFTVGECGMPMEQARCPECDSPIGGQHHQAAAGVRHANEIEQLGAGLADRLQIF